jgi:hypothetical protein
MVEVMTRLYTEFAQSYMAQARWTFLLEVGCGFIENGIKKAIRMANGFQYTDNTEN